MPDLTPIDDPNVKIPAAVRASSALAEQLHQAVYTAGDTPSDGETGKQEGNGPNAAPDATQQPTARELSAASLQDAPQRESPPQDDQVTQQGNEVNWEHRYNSMKGRYDRSQQQVNALSERVGQLEAMLSAAPRMSASDAPMQPQVAAERLLTPEEEEEYGSEFLSVVEKKAREAFAPMAAQYEQQIARLEAQVNGVHGHVVQSVQEKMFSSLDTKLSSWREVNTDPEFLSWLRLPDPYSGAIRHELLKAAYERHDAPRVLAFFNGFLAEEAAVAPANAGPDQTPKGKIPLEKFAAPSRAKSAAAQNAPAEKPGFTAAQISAFYSDIRAGKFSGREAEKNQIERQIFEAQRLGLIRS